MTRSGLVPSLVLISGAVAALDLRNFPGATAGPGYVSLPINPARRDASSVQRRAATADVNLKNYRTYDYTINVTLGTPGQTVEVAFDTGSSELWVDPDCATASRAKNSSDGSTTIVDSPLTDPAACKLRGTYDPSKSSSKADPGLKSTTFTYGDFTSVTVDYVEDTLSIGGLSIKNQIFGVATKSNQTGVGIMGFAPSPFGFNNSGMYDLVLTSLAAQGAIASPAFSLDLRDLDNATGSVIFGGVDKKRYTGSLATIPFETVQKKSSNGQSFTDYSYWVKVSSMTLQLPNSTSTKNMDLPSGGFIADLDSGTGAILAPPGVAAQLCGFLGGEPQAASSNMCHVDCALRKQSGGMTFALAGKNIVVGYDNLISEDDFGAGTVCSTYIADSAIVSDPPTYILGAPFLRDAYAVFDWNNSAVHIAQAADCGTNVVAISSGPNGVPSGNGDCSFGVRSVAVNFGLLFGAAVFGAVMLL